MPQQHRQLRDAFKSNDLKRDDFAHEIILTRKNQDLMALLDQRMKETKRISLEEAEAMLER